MKDITIKDLMDSLEKGDRSEKHMKITPQSQFYPHQFLMSVYNPLAAAQLLQQRQAESLLNAIGAPQNQFGQGLGGMIYDSVFGQNK